MNSHDKRYYELTTLKKLERSRHLKDELTDMIKKTKEKIAYEEMTRQLGNIVSDEAIRKYLQLLKGFSIRKERILSHLSSTVNVDVLSGKKHFGYFGRVLRLSKPQKIDLYSSTWMRNGFMLSASKPTEK